MSPVPPPTTAIGEWPCRCRCASAIIRQQVTDVQARGGRIEADVPGDLLARQHVAGAFGGVVDQPPPLEFAVKVHQPLL